MNPLLPSLLFFLALHPLSSASADGVLTRGFSRKPDSSPPPLSADLLFERLLQDPTGNFSFGFLTGKTTRQLDLAVVHLPSAFPVWRAGAAVRSSASLSLSFDGYLLLSVENSKGKVALWKVGSSNGTTLRLLPSSNLQILDSTDTTAVWESFDSPSSTLVSGQNLRSSAALSSSGGRFSFRLGADFMALYLNSAAGKTDAVTYWKKTAMQTFATIVPGGGPIYATLNETGYLALYQNESARVDVEPFGSSNQNLSGLWRMTLEDDGNLNAYYWNSSSWELDYSAIRDPCELPDYCGAYGLCSKGEKMTSCQCLNGGDINSCPPAGEGDLCGQGEEYTVVRRKGVELAYSEFLNGVQVKSEEECERGCERNCSCWGALYNNQTNKCYRMRFHVQTLVKTSENRVGYFKVRVVGGGGGGGGDGGGGRKKVVLACLLVLGGIVSVAAGAVWWRRRDRRRRSGGGVLVIEGISPGPYKEFHGSTSFRDVELSSSNK